MPLTTLNGINPSGGSSPSAAASGLKEWASGDALAATDLITDLRDEQEAARLGLLSGLLAGGVCTASALNVTVPVDTVYFARSVWQVVTSAAVIGVPDNATTYLWGCSDGQIRQTSTTTPPTSFDNTTACIIIKATAVSGVITLDFSVAQWARQAWGAARVTTENNPSFAPVMDTVPLGATVIIPVGSQQQLFGSLQVSGSLIVRGRLKVTA